MKIILIHTLIIFMFGTSLIKADSREPKEHLLNAKRKGQHNDMTIHGSPFHNKRQSSLTKAISEKNCGENQLCNKEKSANDLLKRLPENYTRMKRDLRDSVNSFNRIRDRSIQPGFLFNPLAKNRRKPSSYVVSTKYAYKFWGENFKLNGSVTVRQYIKRKIWIVLEYTVSGIGNGSAVIVTTDYDIGVTNSLRPTDDVIKPRNCHLQSDESATKSVKPTNVCLKPTNEKTINNGAVHRAVKGERISNMPSKSSTPAIVKQLLLNKRTKQSTRNKKLKRMTTLPLRAGQDCQVKVTDYKRTYLCMNSVLLPCFLISFQGQIYVMKQKICPNH